MFQSKMMEARKFVLQQDFVGIWDQLRSLTRVVYANWYVSFRFFKICLFLIMNGNYHPINF